MKEVREILIRIYASLFDKEPQKFWTDETLERSIEKRISVLREKSGISKSIKNRIEPINGGNEVTMKEEDPLIKFVEQSEVWVTPRGTFSSLIDGKRWHFIERAPIKVSQNVKKILEEAGKL